MSARFERLVLVGSESLVGRELLERLDASDLAIGDVRLVEPGSDRAVLASVAGQLRAAVPGLGDELVEADVVACCEPVGPEDRAQLVAAARHSLVIDLCDQLGGRPADGLDRRTPIPAAGLLASPSAAALSVAALARSARAAGSSAPLVAVALEPASEIGRDAMDELHAQATALFRFESLPTETFGAQAVHDVVSPGARGREREGRLRGELEGLLPGGPAVSLLRVQAGTFHGTAIAARGTVSAAAWRQALAAEPRLAVVETASPVGAVQAEATLVGRLEDDGAGGAWAWTATDSLTQGSVGNAIELLRRALDDEDVGDVPEGEASVGAPDEA